MTVPLCVTVCAFGTGTGGYGVESNGIVQEDYEGMEKDTLVSKLKQVGLPLSHQGGTA